MRLADPRAFDSLRSKHNLPSAFCTPAATAPVGEVIQTFPLEKRWRFDVVIREEAGHVDLFFFGRTESEQIRTLAETIVGRTGHSFSIGLAKPKHLRAAE